MHINSSYIVLFSKIPESYLILVSGYFPDPADCSKFYRCTDIYGNGLLQTYMFECPAGTVFDIKVGYLYSISLINSERDGGIVL